MNIVKARLYTLHCPRISRYTLIARHLCTNEYGTHHHRSRLQRGTDLERLRRPGMAGTCPARPGTTPCRWRWVSLKPVPRYRRRALGQLSTNPARARHWSRGSGRQSTCPDHSTAHVVVKTTRSAAQASFVSMLGGSDSRAVAVSCGAGLLPPASRRGAGAGRPPRSLNR